MLDARHIFRKVTRAVYDFSPEQMKNLSSIVWLYRGQEDRFANLVAEYLTTAQDAAQGASFDALSEALEEALAYFKQHSDASDLETALAKLKEDTASYSAQASKLTEPQAEIAALTNGLAQTTIVADAAKTLIKEIDRIAKLATQMQEACVTAGEKAADGKKHLKAIETERQELTGDPNVQLIVTGALKRLRYFTDQADWLLSRFPEGKLADVEGLVKLVDQTELAERDYSLTAGRYVGVAPEVEDADFDFDEAIQAIHEKLGTLNDEAALLAETIAKNFGELIV